MLLSVSTALLGDCDIHQLLSLLRMDHATSALSSDVAVVDDTKECQNGGVVSGAYISIMQEMTTQILLYQYDSIHVLLLSILCADHWL